MSPIVVRAAARRQFSILRAARSAARSFESHPFQRLSVTKPAKADWSSEVKRVGKNVAIFFPGMTMLLGWPFAAKRVFNGHV